MTKIYKKVFLNHLSENLIISIHRDLWCSLSKKTMKTITNLLSVILFSFSTTETRASITFNSIPPGTVIEPEHYMSQGLILSTDLGQHIYVTTSSSINTSLGLMLRASGNGKIGLTFFSPNTLNPGTVSSCKLMIADDNPGTGNYTATYFDIDGQQMLQIGNNRNYLVGDGYSTDPGSHYIEFVPNNPDSQFINSISFTEIKGVPEPSTLSLISLVLCWGVIRRNR